MQAASLNRTSHQLLQNMADFRYLLTTFGQQNVKLSHSAGIQVRQYELLLQIAGAADDVKVTVAYTAARLGLKHNSAVELIDRTEREGFLCREEDEDDRRCTVLRLTDSGRKALANLTELQARELTSLGPFFVDLLKQVEDCMTAQ